MNLFCCLYKSQDGFYSAFSPYLQLEHQKDTTPTHAIPSFPSPVLYVQPSSGVVQCGDTLSFICTVPSHPLPQLNKPVTFFLRRTAEQTGVTSVILQPQASHVSGWEPQPGVFTVGPVRGGEEGEYTCLYQITNRGQLVNSTVSNVVQVTVTDVLPVPSLVLQQQTDVWHLLCIGSPQYPGAVFSLYLEDYEFPVGSHTAKAFQNQVAFPVPVQDTPVALYQCQYSVFVGKKRSDSKRSLPVVVTRGNSLPSSPGVDWPLVLGSFSAGVLFLAALALVAVVVYRKIKARAEEKKKRQDAQFWTQVHGKDHVVDLTLRRTSFPSQEWTSRDTETAHRSSLWNPFSTFTAPVL
ncbi:immunoglobulin superfamily member 1 [Pholidichthys leucotaenia]